MPPLVAFRYCTQKLRCELWKPAASSSRRRDPSPGAKPWCLTWSEASAESLACGDHTKRFRCTSLPLRARPQPARAKTRRGDSGCPSFQALGSYASSAPWLRSSVSRSPGVANSRAEKSTQNSSHAEKSPSSVAKSSLGSVINELPVSGREVRRINLRRESLRPDSYIALGSHRPQRAS